MVYRQWLTVKTRTFITTPICHLRRWLAALPFEKSWGLDGLLKSVFIVATFLASSLEFRAKRSRDKHFSECSLNQLSQKYNLTPYWSCRMSRIKLETSHLPATGACDLKVLHRVGKRLPRLEDRDWRHRLLFRNWCWILVEGNRISKLDFSCLCLACLLYTGVLFVCLKC